MPRLRIVRAIAKPAAIAAKRYGPERIVAAGIAGVVSPALPDRETLPGIMVDMDKNER
jgi:hypothetical protein